MPPRRSGGSWRWNFSKGSTSGNAISLSSTEPSVETEPSEDPPTGGPEATPEPMMPSQPAVIEISSDSSQQYPNYMDQEETTGGYYVQESSFQGESTNNVGSDNENYELQMPSLHSPGVIFPDYYTPPEAWPMPMIDENATCDQLTDFPMDPVDPMEYANYVMQEQTRRLASYFPQEQPQMGQNQQGPDVTMARNFEQGESSQRRRLTPEDTRDKTVGEIARMRKESRFPQWTRGPIIRHTARKSVRLPPRIARPAKVVRCYLCNEERFHSDQCPYSLGMEELICHKCGEHGHYWTICPQNQSNQPPAPPLHSPAAGPSERRSPSPNHSFSSSRN